jgi:hypothetical protein
MPAQDVVVTPQAYYTPDGRRHVTQQRGLNIVRMSDGTTKKVSTQRGRSFFDKADKIKLQNRMA